MMYLPLVVSDPVAPVPDLVVVRVLDGHLSHDGGQRNQNASHNFPSLFEEKNKNRLCSKTCGIDKIVKKIQGKILPRDPIWTFYYDWQLKRTGSHPEEKS